MRGDLGGFQLHFPALLGNLEGRHRLAGFRAHQARRALEVAIRIGADADDAVVDHLQAHRGGTGLGRMHHHAFGIAIDLLRAGRAGHGQPGQRDRQALGERASPRLDRVVVVHVLSLWVMRGGRAGALPARRSDGGYFQVSSLIFSSVSALEKFTP